MKISISSCSVEVLLNFCNFRFNLRVKVRVSPKAYETISGAYKRII